MKYLGTRTEFITGTQSEIGEKINSWKKTHRGAVILSEDHSHSMNNDVITVVVRLHFEMWTKS